MKLGVCLCALLVAAAAVPALCGDAWEGTLTATDKLNVVEFALKNIGTADKTILAWNTPFVTQVDGQNMLDGPQFVVENGADKVKFDGPHMRRSEDFVWDGHLITIPAGQTKTARVDLSTGYKDIKPGTKVSPNFVIITVEKDGPCTEKETLKKKLNFCKIKSTATDTLKAGIQITLEAQTPKATEEHKDKGKDPTSPGPAAGAPTVAAPDAGTPATAAPRPQTDASAPPVADPKGGDKGKGSLKSSVFLEMMKKHKKKHRSRSKAVFVTKSYSDANFAATVDKVCTEPQKTAITTSIASAIPKLNAVETHIKAANCRNHATYKKWFGATTDEQHARMIAVVEATKPRLADADATYACVIDPPAPKPGTLADSCSMPGVFAYVSGLRVYPVHMCGLFFESDATAQWMTTIHELTHLNPPSTDDRPLNGGRTFQLSATPENAVNNAESYAKICSEDPPAVCPA